MINLDNVSKKYATGTAALSDVSFSVDKGEFAFLVGTTGAGKSTIFKLIIRDLLPTEGKVFVGEWDIVNLPKDKVSHLRKKIGVIFQDLKLLADRTVFENISLPLEVAGRETKESIKIVEELLEQVGLKEHKDKFPVQLSGGELQRVAIARALVLSPEILLADEPTGNLDDETSWGIINLLSEINKKGTTILMATHNSNIVKSLGKKVIQLEKGKVIKGGKEKKEDKEEKKEEHEEKEKVEEKE
jgi:cell division transport system ATP-binding protein